MMRKLMGVVALLALALVLANGVAEAKFVAWGGGSCVGTEFSDSISGFNSTTVADDIKGLGSSDHIETLAGNDIADGGAGDDSVSGQLGNDTLSGGSGKDFIDGGKGRDTINGGTGSDNITSVEPQNLPAERDIVDCGEDSNGKDVDTAFVDRIDIVKNCEKVFYSSK
jgi:Ca2+-binding RTX toxin-like protein